MIYKGYKVQLNFALKILHAYKLQSGCQQQGYFFPVIGGNRSCSGDNNGHKGAVT